MNVTTYQHAYVQGCSVSLCARHDERHDFGSLAGVEHGGHDGHCDQCDHDAGRPINWQLAELVDGVAL